MPVNFHAGVLFLLSFVLFSVQAVVQCMHATVVYHRVVFFRNVTPSFTPGCVTSAHQVIMVLDAMYIDTYKEEATGVALFPTIRKHNQK